MTDPCPACGALPCDHSHRPAINMNDYVWIKLNDHGRNYRKLAHERIFNGKIAYTPLKTNAHGWSKLPLWDVMHTFGPLCYMGGRAPFETEIRFTEPTS